MSLVERARELRKNATESERLLWSHLRAHRLQGFKFRRQHPMGRYIVDFVCLESRCVVEADGGQHLEQVEYDRMRDDWLRSQGFVVLRFWNNDILTNTEGVLMKILEVCNSPHPNPSPSRGGAYAADKLESENITPLSRRGRGAGGQGDL